MVVLWTKNRHAVDRSGGFAARPSKFDRLLKWFPRGQLGMGAWLGQDGTAIKVFFLGGGRAAGALGGLTAARRILWIQAWPAAIGHRQAVGVRLAQARRRRSRGR